MSPHRRRNKPGFVQVFESDLREISESCEHPAPIILVWLACCRLENISRIERTDFSFTAPIKIISQYASISHRATATALDHLEGLGLLGVYRAYSSPGTRHPDKPSTYKLCGALQIEPL